MKVSKKSLYIVISVLFCSAVMSFIDGVISPPYMVKSGLKMVLFLLVPLIYFLLNKEDSHILKGLFLPRKKDLKLALLLGAGVYLIVIGGYLLLGRFIDFSGIAESLTTGIGVNAGNFVYVALYISFVNSLLEEFFFRGFSFILLKKETSAKFAYVFSSALFALYHLGMTGGWFSPVIYVLALSGLFVGGCIFNFLNDKCENIYPSWLVHMCANFAINTVGFIIFGII